MRTIGADAVHERLTWDRLSDALVAVLAPDADVAAPERIVVPVSSSPDDEHTLLLMPSWQHGSIGGVKIVHHVPANAQRGRPTVQAVFVVSDTSTGATLAVVDGDALTTRRTAAISALAGRSLVRDDARHLLVVGTGQLAPVLADAHLAAHGYERVTVWGRDPERAAATAATIRRHVGRATVDVSDRLRQSVRDADVIVTATGATSPLVHGEDVGPGTHVSLVGSYKADMREADAALMERATVFVDTLDGASAAGELAHRETEAGDAVTADLADLVNRRHGGRRSDAEVTVFKSAGFALADLAAARVVLDV